MFGGSSFIGMSDRISYLVSSKAYLVFRSRFTDHEIRDTRYDSRFSHEIRFTRYEIRSSGGFTFVEILITLLVLGITVAPMMGLYTTAIQQVTYTDDLRTALDLAREEMEKVKNLALTEGQIKQIGNLISSPIRLNRKIWYTVRVVDPEAMLLEVQVFVYQGTLKGRPLVTLATIFSK